MFYMQTLHFTGLNLLAKVYRFIIAGAVVFNFIHLVSDGF